MLKIDICAFFDQCALDVAERFGTPFLSHIDFSRKVSGYLMPPHLGPRLEAFAQAMQHNNALLHRTYAAVMLDKCNIVDFMPPGYWD